jgi:hypothetical protein
VATTTDPQAADGVVIMRARWLSDDIAIGLARCAACGEIAPVGQFGSVWQYGPHRDWNGACPNTAHQFVPDHILRGRAG